jgi:carbon-monoxide dehydrogenase medium subunit
MKPASFEYFAPETLDDALSILGDRGDQAKLLAGGQSLIPAMNFRLAQPAVLIDLNRVSELGYVRQNGSGGLQIGAMTRQRQLERDPLIAKHTPLLHETMPFIAHPQIRNRGTLGGSLAHADPAAELPVIAVASEWRMRARSRAGERSIPAREFFLGMFATALQPDEILIEVAIPAMSPRSGWAFMEVARRHGDYAMMGVAVLVTLGESGVCQDARLVFLNAGDGPVAAREAARRLVGEKPDAGLFEAAALEASQDEIMPLGNIHASVDYQRHLARVLTQRALGVAFRRAASGEAWKA